MDEGRLSSVPLFAGLPKKHRRRLAQICDEVDIAEGKEVVHEGRAAHEFFVIESGSAEVLRGDRHVADLGPGDFFGEVGVIGRTARNATVVARSPMTAIVMNAHEFRQVAQDEPDVAAAVQAAITERTAPA